MILHSRRLLNFLTLPVLVGSLAVPAFAESESLETLLAYLKSPNPKTRRDAANELGKRRARNQPVVEALAAAVRSDSDHNVRVEAVRSLGLIKDFSALGEMLGAVKDSHSDVRLSAVKALVSLYTEHDIDFITNRRAGWNMINPFLDTSDHEIIEPYILVDPVIVGALGESARGDHHRDVRVASVRALGVLRGSAALPQLAEALNADPDMRVEVIRSFIKIGDPEAGPHLLPFFRDSNAKVRTQAMIGAGMLKYKPAVEPLMSVYGLGPEQKGVISRVTSKVKGLFAYLPPRDEAALWALALIGDEMSEQVFVENMIGENSSRRQYAFEGLARIGESRYGDQISRLVLTENDHEVRLAQHWALYKMGSGPYLHHVVKKLDSDQERQARDYLLEVTSPSDLYPYVRSSNSTVRRKVIEILGQIGDEATIRELEPVARASGAETADTAVVAIKRIEWRLAGRPSASDAVYRRDDRPRRSANQ